LAKPSPTSSPRTAIAYSERVAGPPTSTDGAIEHVAIDVGDDGSVRDGVSNVMSEAGRIDVLVNCAGYLCAGAVEEVSLHDAKAQFETNYFGVVRMSVATPAGIDAYAGSRGRAMGAMADFDRKAPGPEVVARKVVEIANDAHPKLRNKITKEAKQFTLAKWLLPSGAFEVAVRRGFKLEA
jgi:NAD(P)-dependent dehydrogenase (short-subunit alcohol dehydrogenase family)